MDKIIDVSIAIITYFHEDYIEECLNSVLSQKTSYTYEILISDDCSKDRTQEIILRYHEKYPDKIFYHFNEKNLGITKNNYFNKCRCRGRYICQLSGDDYWIDDNKIQKQVEFLDANPQYVGATTNVECRYGNEKVSCLVNPKKSIRGKELSLEYFQKYGELYTHGIMVKNFFLTDEGRQYFHSMIDVSEKIDDTTECILYLNKGPIFCMDFNAVVYRMQERNSNGNNYNSLNSYDKHVDNMLSLLNNLEDLKMERVNLFHLYKRLFGTYLAYNLIHFSLKKYKEKYQYMPKRYKNFSMWLSVFMYSVRVSFSTIIKRCVKKRRRLKNAA